jgi:hypothetical protein
MPYRSDIEAANARIARLEEERARLEKERARLARALDAKPSASSSGAGPWLWGALVLAAAGAALLGLVVPTARPPTRRDLSPSPTPEMLSTAYALGGLGGVSAATPSLGAIAAPVPAIEPAPDAAWAPVIAMESGAVRALDSPPTPDDPAFFGQYWEARVTHTHEGGPPVGTECLVTLAPRPPGDAGVATIRCGSELIHGAMVSPPDRAADRRGFCWFDGTDLYCAPPEGSTQVCWINTNTRVARCGRDIDLDVHTVMRDPRERPPPDRM